MSVESSTRTIYSLTVNKTRISLLHHPSSSGDLKYRDFVKYYDDPSGEGDRYVVKAANQDEAIGQVMGLRVSKPGDRKPLDIVLFEGGAGSATGAGGASGGGPFVTGITGPDANGIIQFIMSDATTVDIDTQDVRLHSGVFNPATNEIDFELRDEEGNVINQFSVPIGSMLNGYKRYRGPLDAATASLPTDAMVGDFWYINNGGESLGNIEQVDRLDVGDMVTYLNLTGDNDPTNPQNWIGEQRNINDLASLALSLEDIPQTISLVAGVTYTVNAVVLAAGDIRDVTVLDAMGEDITSGLTIDIAGTSVDITSNVNLSNLVVHLRGIA